MRLTVRDVGRLLQVSDKTISRWIRQRGLPARFIGGQYRFNRVDLLEWAIANRLQVAVEVFDELEDEEDAAPSLAAALERGKIHEWVEASSKDEALGALVALLPLPEDVDREVLLRLFQMREASASTAIGNGIAIPHVRNPVVLHVDRPLVTLCFLAQPVPFGAPDGRPVHALFSLICPTIQSHLQTLSRLSFALNDKNFKALITTRQSGQHILREARRIEAGLETESKPPGSGR